MGTVKWIKIVTDIFDDDKIKLIEKLPEADTILVIWFKLLCLAGKINCGGFLMLTKNIPYTDEMLAAVFNRPLNTVRLALNVFSQYGMIEIAENTIAIINWEKHQNLEKLKKQREDSNLRVKAYRDRQRQNLLTEKNNKCNALQPVTTKPGNAAEQDKDKETDTTTCITFSGGRSSDETDNLSEILTAAENAGFSQNKSTKLKILQLCEQYGMATVLTGIDACVEHSNTKPSYLRGCCAKIHGNKQTDEPDPFLPKDHDYMEW